MLFPSSTPALKSAADLNECVYVFEGGHNGTEFDISGVTFLYRIILKGDALWEELTARGPLAEPLSVEVT